MPSARRPSTDWCGRSRCKLSRPAQRAAWGLIIAHGLLFSGEGARALIEEWSAPYQRPGREVFYVELTAPLDVRLERNATENRARHKKTDWSTPERLRDMETWGRWNSDGTLLDPERHIFIDNTAQTARDTALAIQQRFAL